MRVLVTTHAQLFKTPNGKVWTKSVYGYRFFERYLEVFDKVRLVCRLKEIDYQDISGYLAVDGENLEVFPLPFYIGPWEYAKSYFKLNKQIEKAINECDCAILRVPDQFSFQLFNKLKRADITCAVEVVAHPWDLFAPGNNKTILRPLIRLYWDYKLKKICSEVNGVSYVTEKYLQKRYPSQISKDDTDRILTSYTSSVIDEDYFYRAKKQDEFLHNDTLKLIHVSGINNYAKGHEVLLKALSVLKSSGLLFRMTFVGGGILLNHYKKLRDQLNLHNEVVFLGNVSERDHLTKLLVDSDLFIFPSLSEGLPRVVIEAMAAGLPCIVSDVGGTSELISDELLLKDPKSIEEIVKKIMLISQSREDLSKQSFKNYNLIRNQYNAKVVQSKRNKFYSSIKLIAEQKAQRTNKERIK